MSAPLAPVAPAIPAPPAAPSSMETAILEAQRRLDASRGSAPAAALAAEIADPSPAPVAPPSAPQPDAIAPPVPGPDAPAAEAPAAADAPAADAAVDPAPAEPALEVEVIELPGRRPDDPPFEIEVPKGEAAERLRQALNNGMRGEEFDAEIASVDQERAQVQLNQDRLEIDPVGYLAPMEPRDRALIALQLLADPAVLDGAAEHLQGLLDPETREGLIKDLRLARAEGARQREEDLRGRAGTRAAAADIKSLLQVLVPPGLTEAQQVLFRRDAQGDIMRAVNASPDGFVHPREVPRLLQPRLQAFGMTDEQITQAIAAAGRGGRRRSRPLPAPPSPPPAPAAPARVAARPTVKQLEAGAQNRAQIRTPPPGAGAPTPARTIPTGLTIEQAVDQFRGQRARPA